MRLSRRAALAAPLPLLAARRGAAASTPPTVVRVDASDRSGLPFDRRAAGIVGVYDLDWLLTPGFQRLLDNLAASPGAFSGVRVFGPFTAGAPERLMPESGGAVWPHPDAPIDLSRTLDALATLTSRGLTPTLALGFFPPAVSPFPIQPPTDWDAYRTLVRAFLDQLAADPRFGGPSALTAWRFEVWNEPNEGRFWSGARDDYLALHRATSQALSTFETESGLAAAGHRLRLGGPAIAYKPQASPEDGAPWMRWFLEAVAADPAMRLDFLSFHRKGTVADDPPDPRRLHDAADEVATLAAEVDPVRFAGLDILNDEADEKVGFEVPYAPRLDAANAAWLAAATVISATVADRHAAASPHGGGHRIIAAADNANLQLVEAPFDGRRSIMTLARPGSAPAASTDLLKLPAYAFYETLRLLGDHRLPVDTTPGALFPATDLFILPTAADTHLGILLARHPLPGNPTLDLLTVDLTLDNLPWPEVNVALFRIDDTHSNAYTAAGGSPANPFPIPDPADLGRIRLAQELALARGACPEPQRRVAHRLPLPDRTHRETLTLPPYATALLWITPYSPAVPLAPAWFEATPEPAGTLLRWDPSTDPTLLSYELFSVDDHTPLNRLTSSSLRAALWVDTDAPPGRRYVLRTLSASGLPSPLTRPEHSASADRP